MCIKYEYKLLLITYQWILLFFSLTIITLVLRLEENIRMSNI